MIKASKKLNINDICKVLKRPRDELFEKLIEWSDKFGFKIDGEYIVIEESANLDGAIADLDKEFISWDKNQKAKNGKI